MIRALLHRVVANPVVYDCIQRLGGFEQTLRRLRPLFGQYGGQTILDVGAGTGNYIPIMPREMRYIWLDNDLRKLQGFKSKGLPGLALVGDATQIALRDDSVDVAFCCAVTHHLTDTEVIRLFRELARVCRNRLIFLDAIDKPDSFVSRVLWRYDRGSYPRPRDVLQQLMTRSFRIVHAEEYKVYHSYVLWVGEPKRSAV